MIEPRLATHIRVAAIRRKAEEKGGFATIIYRGDPVAGALLIVVRTMDNPLQLWEEMPDLDKGGRNWQQVSAQSLSSQQDIDAYCARRRHSDTDLWVLELDIASMQHLNDYLPDKA